MEDFADYGYIEDCVSTDLSFESNDGCSTLEFNEKLKKTNPQFFQNMECSSDTIESESSVNISPVSVNCKPQHSNTPQDESETVSVPVVVSKEHFMSDLPEMNINQTTHSEREKVSTPCSFVTDEDSLTDDMFLTPEKLKSSSDGEIEIEKKQRNQTPHPKKQETKRDEEIFEHGFVIVEPPPKQNHRRSKSAPEVDLHAALSDSLIDLLNKSMAVGPIGGDEKKNECHEKKKKSKKGHRKTRSLFTFSLKRKSGKVQKQRIITPIYHV